MQPHEERVVVEKRELDEKLSKLREFRMGKIYSTLDPVDRALLESQEGAMSKYAEILGRRIERFHAASKSS